MAAEASDSAPLEGVPEDAAPAPAVLVEVDGDAEAADAEAADAEAALADTLAALEAPVIDQHGVTLRPDVPPALEDEEGNPFVLAQGMLAKKSDSSFTKGSRKARFFVLCPDHWGFYHFAEEAGIDPAGYMHGRCTLTRLRKFSADGARVLLASVLGVETDGMSNEFAVHFTKEDGGGAGVVNVIAPSIEAATVWTTALEAWSEFAKAQAEEESAAEAAEAPAPAAPATEGAEGEAADGLGALPASPPRAPRTRQRRGSMLGRIRASMFGGEEEAAGADGGAPAPPGGEEAAPEAAPPDEGPRTRRRSVVRPPAAPTTGGDGTAPAPGPGSAPGPASPRGKRRGSILQTASRLLVGEEDEASKRAKAKAAKARAEAAAKAAFVKAAEARARAREAAEAAAAVANSFLVFVWPYIKVYASLEEAARAAAKKRTGAQLGRGRGTGAPLALTWNEHVPETLPAGGAPAPARGLNAWAVPVPRGDPRVGVDLRGTAGEEFWANPAGQPLAVMHGWLSKRDRSGVVGTARHRYFVLTPSHLAYFLEPAHAALDADGFMGGKAAGNNTGRFTRSGAAIPLEGIVDVRIATERVRVMKMATRASAGSADFSDDEEEEGEGGSEGAAAAAGAGGEEGEGDDGLWEYIEQPTCVLELDMGDALLVVDAHNARSRDAWATAVREWSKIRKRKLDEGTFAAFGDAAQHRMFNQVTEKGKASAKKKGT